MLIMEDVEFNSTPLKRTASVSAGYNHRLKMKMWKIGIQKVSSTVLRT